MDNTVATLDRVAADLDRVLRADAAATMPDAEKMSVLRAAGDVMRRLEAVIAETVATVDTRPAGSGAPTFAAVFGCRNINELLRRVLRIDAPGAARVVKAAGLIHRDVELTSGEPLPARWPALRTAMLEGTIGIAGMLAATGPIEQAGGRIGTRERLQADAVLADIARGCPAMESVDAAADVAPPATPDDLRPLAHEIAIRLDPDGTEPAETRSFQERYLSIGRMRNGVYPIRGNLLPETYAQLQLILDAQLNPKVDGPPVPGVVFQPSDVLSDPDGDSDEFNSDPRNVIDSRSARQKQHDALAAALGIAARHRDMPSLGGAAPTLVVQVDAGDYAAGSGWASIPGVEEPVPLTAATHTACTGTIQRVLFDEGRIAGISTTDRIFTVHQRRAIVLRDRECLIPGCHVPASWCEIHHVIEYARGGPTCTDNGVPLCWWHHRSLDVSGWEIRMQDGLPRIRGPAWWDPSRQWRTPRPSLEAFAAAGG